MASRSTRLRIDPRDARFGVCPKIGYDAYADAQAIAESMMAHDLASPGHHIDAYRCLTCDRFHVGERLVVFKRGV